MIRAGDYYRLYERTVFSLSELKSYIEAIQEFAESKNYRVFWRGQANFEWGLTSSLVRKLMIFGSVDDKLINRIEDKILDEASTWIQDFSNNNKYQYPLAKLAYLQHHKVPTRLIDFTSDPWIAVFFAAEGPENIDGRIFAIIVKDSDVLSQTPNGTPWRKYQIDEIKMFDPTQANIVFPRLKMQKGVLALGRLPSTKPYREAYDELLGKNRRLLAEEVRQILSIPFKLSPFNPTNNTSCISSKAKPPIGITFRLHVDKISVRRDLAGTGLGRKVSPSNQKITHQQVFPDVEGMVSHSTILAGLEKGLLLI